jgi:hypothetical protein
MPQRREARVEIPEDHVLLGPEIGEEGRRGDIRGRSDIGHGGGLETAAGVEIECGVHDRLAGASFLAFPQSGARHPTSLPHNPVLGLIIDWLDF